MILLRNNHEKQNSLMLSVSKGNTKWIHPTIIKRVISIHNIKWKDDLLSNPLCRLIQSIPQHNHNSSRVKETVFYMRQ